MAPRHTSTAQLELTPPAKAKDNLNKSPTPGEFTPPAKAKENLSKSPSSGDYFTPRSVTDPETTHSPPNDYVLKMGKSKFYKKSSADDIDRSTDDELDYDDKIVDTDTASHTSVETTETLPAKDVASSPDPGE